MGFTANLEPSRVWQETLALLVGLERERAATPSGADDAWVPGQVLWVHAAQAGKLVRAPVEQVCNLGRGRKVRVEAPRWVAVDALLLLAEGRRGGKEEKKEKKKKKKRVGSG